MKGRATPGPAVVELLGDGVLARGLLSGDPRLAGLLAHDPAAPLASAREAAARPIDRDALVDALLPGLARLEAPGEARAAAERLRQPGVVAVVTGQQPGLLGGSLLVLVKALAAAAHARALEAEGIPAVPVFWHASEDDDHAEADHVALRTASGVRRLSLPLPGDRRMLSHVPVPPAATALVHDVLAALPEGAGRPVLGALLPPRPGESFATWTGRLLARVLGRQGIVLAEPGSLRGVAAPVARHDRAHPGALRAAVRRAEERVTAAGYAPPLALRRDALTFDVDDAGHRGVPEGGALPDPARIAWNVVTRVLAQDLALPVAAHVCGPAELGYVSLFGEAHALLGVPAPAAVLRPGLTLVEPAVRRACEALGVAPADVVRRGAAALPAPAIAGAERLDALDAVLAALPEGRSPAARRRRAELVRNAGLLRAALLREARRADAARERRTARVLDGLRPLGSLQERVLSFLPLYAAGGDAVLARLSEVLGTGEPVHHVLPTEDVPELPLAGLARDEDPTA